MKYTDSQYEIVTDESALRALQAEWNELWARARGAHNQSFDFCWIAWEQIAKPNGRSLRCIVRRDAGRVVMVWPLVTYRRLFLWTCLIPLSPESAGYSRVLVEDGAQTAAWIEAAWRVARMRCGADFIHMPYVPEDTVLGGLVANAHRPVIRERVDAYIARLSTESRRHDWQGFCDSLGTLHKKRPGKAEQRMSKAGKVSVRLVDPFDTVRIAESVDAMLNWKRSWGSRVNKRGHWLDSAHYRNFLVAWLTSGAASTAMTIPAPTTTPAATPARLLVVTLDGRPVAVNIFCTDMRGVSGIISGFDPDCSKWSPGLIGVEHVAKWAFERQLDFDFGTGSEHFKSFWSRGNLSYCWTVQSVNSWWGRVALDVRRFPRAFLAMVRALARRDPEQPRVDDAPTSGHATLSQCAQTDNPMR
ncbi:GNAT family N-acetyltransferase [Paraburkholderia diazotrophica]|uniref:GNAT family N-acetyltransferase n=1 Tax=Paraburkholderia diazotrophica TaxID=667676 RepID=UPI003175011C